MRLNDAQRRWVFLHHPAMADERRQKETPKGAELMRLNDVQRRWMFLHHPAMADERRQKETPKGADLSEHVKKAFFDELLKIASISILDGTSEEVKSFLSSYPNATASLLSIEKTRQRPRKTLIEWMEGQLGSQKEADFKISPPTKQREEYPYQGTASVAGLKIDVENKKGTIRKGEDPGGHEWSTKMRYHYGEIRGTEGKDGDPVDVCLGPNEKSKKVFIIHQQDPKTKKFDEDKVMVGFDSAEEAKAMYLKHYDKPGFFQSMDETTFPGLKKLLTDKAGKKLTTKTAKPRWAREIMSLSPEEQQRLLRSVPDKVREIRPLGHGGERISDLVAHPQYGVSVRKVPLFKEDSAAHVDAVLGASAKQIAMENKLKDVAKGKGSFAHILGSSGAGSPAYYEFAGLDPELSAMERKWARVHAAHESTLKMLNNERESSKVNLRAKFPAGSPELDQALKANYARINTRRIAANKELSDATLDLEKFFFGKQTLDPETQKVVNTLRKSYPGLHDIRRPNIINGRIVDLSPEVRTIPYTSSGKLEDPVGFSKGKALGGSAPAEAPTPQVSTPPTMPGWLSANPWKTSLIAGGVGAGLGAGIGAATGVEGTRKRRALIGAGIGGAVGMGSAGLAHLLTRR